MSGLMSPDDQFPQYFVFESGLVFGVFPFIELLQEIFELGDQRCFMFKEVFFESISFILEDRTLVVPNDPIEFALAFDQIKRIQSAIHWA